VIETPAPARSSVSTQDSNMTRRSFQPFTGPMKIDPPTPDRLATGGSLDTFDTMSAQSVDSVYGGQRHHRQNSSWTTGSHYSDLVSPYNKHQRTPCAIQAQFSAAPKVEPSLPSIHDLTYNQPFPTANTYGYGSSNTGYGDRSYTMKAEAPPYFEPTHRYAQSYSQINRPTPSHMDYQKYPPSMYDFNRGISYPAPYPMDYMPSPTGSHAPVSPTVSNEGGYSLGGRKRRGNLPKTITDYFKAWVMQNLEHPYPTEDDKHTFQAQTGLTSSQVRRPSPDLE
jgi:hypothetical protein